jgi:hypothetical protein
VSRRVVELIDTAIEQALGLAKAFCPTGPGGGVDNSCSPKGGGKGGDDAFASSRLFTEDEIKGGDTSQPAETKEDIYKLARAARPDFVAILDTGEGVDKTIGANAAHVDTAEGFAEAIQTKGHTVIIGGLKSEKRATEKVEGKYEGDWSRLKDVVRATVAVDSKEDIPKAVGAIRSHMEAKGYELVEVDNRMEHPNAAGYRDINTVWRSPDGFCTELQINTKAMIRAKEIGEGHKMFERARHIAETPGREKRQATTEERAELDDLNARMRVLYGKAWDEG